MLAYHYLTEGHTLAALDQLREVAALQPRDGLSPQLARRLEPNAGAGVGAGAGAGPAVAAAGSSSGATPSTSSVLGPSSTSPFQETSATVPSTALAPPPQPSTAPVREGRLEGTWTAQPDRDTTITVTFPDPTHFNWTLTRQGQSRQLQGRLTYGNGILTLAQDQGPAIVGNTTWTDEKHFKFQVPGGGPDDPGLTFAKQ